jgi:uncharacterized protein (DUF1499 family)
MLDFATFERATTPNTYLACTPELCRVARADEPAPTFARPVADVRAALVALQPDAEIVEAGGRVQAHYVATTRVMRFRDDVDVLLAPTANGGTQVAVYSRSRVGFSDLGANRKRVKALLKALAARLA